MLSRKQFPVRLSFGITINKSQGHTIPNVVIYLARHVFSHGQLCVSLSRGVSQNSTKVLIKEGKIEGEEGDFTKNVGYSFIAIITMFLLHNMSFIHLCYDVTNYY